VESTGNFHGEPLAFASDFLAIAAAEVGAIAERRVDRMLDPHRSEGLPPFLAEEPGVNSGMMVAQYTAAALVAENRRLAAPASVDSIPTSGMQEDHVSMGWGQEAAMRMLMNNLDPAVAERPEDLVVYGGTGRAARSWEAFDAIVRELKVLRDDQTLLVQSGKPVGVFDTHEWAPRVLISNA